MASEIAKAYSTIQSLILDGTLAGGTRIEFDDLVALCGVAERYLLAAVEQLVADTYLVSTDNDRVVTVNCWSLAEALALFDAEAKVMGDHACVAAGDFNKSRHDAMYGVYVRISDTLDSDFYDVNFILSEYDAFLRALDPHSREPERHRAPKVFPLMRKLLLDYSHQQFAEINTELKRIIDAVAVRDSDWSRDIAESHILSLKRSFYMRVHPEEDFPMIRH